MKNIQKLRDYGIAMVCVGILNLFNFLTTFIEGIADGSVNNAFAGADPTVIAVIKVVIGTIAVIMGLIAFADAIIGIKGIRVSAKPTAENGYITVAKVFWVLSILGVVGAIIALTDSNGSVVDKIIVLSNAVLTATIYYCFIAAANAVRKDVLNGESK